MNNEEKISILLKEYDSLRTHLLQRLQNRFHFFVLFGAITAFAFFKPENKLTRFQFIILLIGAVFLLGVWFWFGGITVRLSKHISSLEKRINDLAGETLLSWETDRAKNSILHPTHNIISGANRVEPIVKTPGEGVEAQGTQAHP